MYTCKTSSRMAPAPQAHQQNPPKNRRITTEQREDKNQRANAGRQLENALNRLIIRITTPTHSAHKPLARVAHAYMR